MLRCKSTRLIATSYCMTHTCIFHVTLNFWSRRMQAARDVCSIRALSAICIALSSTLATVSMLFKMVDNQNWKTMSRHRTILCTIDIFIKESTNLLSGLWHRSTKACTAASAMLLRGVSHAVPRGHCGSSQGVLVGKAYSVHKQHSAPAFSHTGA